jgi:hypothetical protein
MQEQPTENDRRAFGGHSFSEGGSMGESLKEEKPNDEKATKTLSGTVDKIIPPIMPGKPEKAQISVDGAEDLYRELRVDNTLEDAGGNTVKLKKGAEVEVKIAADPEDTKPHEPTKTDEK